MLGAQCTQLVLGSLPVKPLWEGQTPSTVRYLLHTLAFLGWSPEGNYWATFLSTLEGEPWLIPL